MNWEAVGAIGEVTGALLVGATLLYLAMQIGQNTRSNRAVLSWSLNQALADLNGRLSGDPELTDIWMRGCDSMEALDPIERERFSRYAMDRLNLAEYVHSSFPHENVTNLHIDYVSWMVRSVANSPGLQQLIESLEGKWVGSQELYEMYRSASAPGAARSGAQPPDSGREFL